MSDLTEGHIHKMELTPNTVWMTKNQRLESSEIQKTNTTVLKKKKQQ